MDSPKRTANINTGTNAGSGVSASMPMCRPAQPPCRTSATTPYAAPRMPRARRRYVTDYPHPKPTDDQVVIEVAAAASLCGTDR